MKCTLVKQEDPKAKVKVALGEAQSKNTLELNKPVDISDLSGLNTERDLSKLKLVDEKGTEIKDSAIDVNKEVALAHAYAVDSKAITEVKANLAGKLFTDDIKTPYTFATPADTFVMKTSFGSFNFNISFYPTYCILRNTDPETKAYPRTDALYYAYEKAENGYKLTMIAPTVPSQYAPAVINLTEEGSAPTEPTMKEQLAGAVFTDAESTYTFDETADNCAMTYSGGTANFTMTYDEDKKQCTMQDKKYNKGAAMTYGYAGDPKTTVTLSLVNPPFDPENPMVPEQIKLTRQNA